MSEGFSMVYSQAEACRATMDQETRWLRGVLADFDAFAKRLSTDWIGEAPQACFAAQQKWTAAFESMNVQLVGKTVDLGEISDNYRTTDRRASGHFTA